MTLWDDPDPEVDPRRDLADKRLPGWVVTPREDALGKIAAIRARLNHEVPAPRQCVVNGCRQPGSNEHHIAPKAVFGAVAESYPTVWLCRDHHELWHDTMNTYYATMAPV